MSVNDLTPGTIGLVDFPFADLNVNKQRPALVLSNVNFAKAHNLVTLAMVTSVITSPWLGDTVLQDWQLAGLLRPSCVRVKLTTMPVTNIRALLGRLTDDDWCSVQANMNSVLALS